MNMNQIIKDKLRAAGIHLLASIILAIICLFCVYEIWYPEPLFKITAVGGIFVLMLAVDLILGPLLTFLVFKRHKKTLKTDMLIIVLIQMIALAYGMYSMYQGRPMFVAYVVDRFELVRANQVVIEPGSDLDWSKGGIQYVNVDVSSLKGNDQLDVFLTEISAGVTPAQRMKFYKSLETAYPSLKANTIALEKLREFNDDEEVNVVLNNYPNADGFLPLTSGSQSMAVLVNSKSSESIIVAIVDLRPWL